KGVGRGTGLGLDIAQRIVVDRHGGSIEVESRPGDTRFRVRLPVDGSDAMAP
ncbi:MAG TPA: ATP-binding protein, partial [Propionibacteriaceae bacterium]|nr:ATP-binding protein [Propionibacteriaceae bacterium]